jgi:biopolymer transport protein ExbB
MLTQKLLAFSLLGAEWILWVLIVLSIISLSVVVDRLIFFVKNRIKMSTVVSTMNSLLSQGKTNEATKFLAKLKGMEGRVSYQTMLKLHIGMDALADFIEAQISAEKMIYEKNLNFLGTLGNNAPFIGLFGTVVGIIKAFHDLSLNAQGGAEAVMSGVSEALVATGVGIFVAIPAVAAYNYFKAMAKTSATNTYVLTRMIQAHFKMEAENHGKHAKG